MDWNALCRSFDRSNIPLLPFASWRRWKRVCAVASRVARRIWCGDEDLCNEHVATVFR
jgi:hypothetical protein